MSSSLDQIIHTPCIAFSGHRDSGKGLQSWIAATILVAFFLNLSFGGKCRAWELMVSILNSDDEHRDRLQIWVSAQ